MKRFLAANEKKSKTGNFREEDDDVALLLAGEDDDLLNFSPTDDDARLLLQHQHAEDADASDIGNQEGWSITQVSEDVTAARPGNDSHNATSDTIGLTATSVSRAVTESTYPHFHQPINYVTLPMVGVNNTDLEPNRGQSIALPPIPTEEEDSKAVKQFAMRLTIVLVALATPFLICSILYLVSEYRQSNFSTSTSSAPKVASITSGALIGVGSKMAPEAVKARKKRRMNHAHCYAGLAIFCALLAFAGIAIALALRVCV
jgi:hypothetical protein